MDTFIQGVIAGYGIAIPVGPIGVLLFDLGIRRGFPAAFAAAAGVATADLVYAAVAAIGGVLVAGALEPYQDPLRIVAAVILLLIAVRVIFRAYRPPQSTQSSQSPPGRAFLSFLALTLLNPVTVTYFAVLILGSGVVVDGSAGQAIAFVAGAFLASLSWQALLAGGGAVLGHRLSERARLLTGLAGGLIVAALATGLLV